MNSPKVSVVIPTYNNAEYILSALSSVFEQTYSDYEIIIVDDGSTDNTKDVLKPFEDKIRYHYQPNQGLAVARNTGMGLAMGTYITYLDADDIWFKDNLKLKCDLLDAHTELAGIFSDFCIFDETGTLHESGTMELFPFFNRTKCTFSDIFSNIDPITIPGKSDSNFYYGEIFNKLFWGNFILPTSMVFRKEYAHEIGLFKPELITQQDYEYWLRFSQKYPFGYIDTVLVRYRRHGKQLTDHSKIKRIITTVVGIIGDYENVFYKNGTKKIYNKRMADLLGNLSKVYSGEGDNKQARQLLAKSLKLNLFQTKAYIVLALSLLPRPIVGIFRKIKNIN